MINKKEAEKSKEQSMEELKGAINSLPIGNRVIFKRIVGLLQKVHEHNVKNKMEAKNIAIVFAPALLRSTTRDLQVMLSESTSAIQVIEFCILHFSSLFDVLFF